MPRPITVSVSFFERVVRSVYCPSQENKKGKLKVSAVYPAIKPDSENPDFCNNKISLQRICRSETNGYAPVVKCALKFERKRKLKGFLEWSCREIYESFPNGEVEIIPDASEENPFHIHLILKGFKVNFTNELKEKLSAGDITYSDILPSPVRAALDRLRNHSKRINIIEGKPEKEFPCVHCFSE